MVKKRFLTNLVDLEPIWMIEAIYPKELSNFISGGSLLQDLDFSKNIRFFIISR